MQKLSLVYIYIFLFVDEGHDIKLPGLPNIGNTFIFAAEFSVACAAVVVFVPKPGELPPSFALLPRVQENEGIY